MLLGRKPKFCIISVIADTRNLSWEGRFSSFFVLELKVRGYSLDGDGGLPYAPLVMLLRAEPVEGLRHRTAVPSEARLRKGSGIRNCNLWLSVNATLNYSSQLFIQLRWILEAKRPSYFFQVVRFRGVNIVFWFFVSISSMRPNNSFLSLWLIGESLTQLTKANFKFALLLPFQNPGALF